MRIIAALVIVVAMAAAESGNKSPASNSVAPPVVQPAVVQPVVRPATVQTGAAIRVEGEKRFRTNCGRCHMSPHKFPPRMMATIVRHMRVRALITDDDMRYILAYMTE
jgi:mono/diheme cytochrome c family protein